ncbi:13158_t:CDS:2 [Cetraspora pellucida]|uniref:13158_t:CDS:1 n=1 Tax=Cetraspora pellucida TaxID=1433469 RepID=A0ACA9MZ88_9GLOM|nr:13158_t:CDS:2 [Cetraspora pellucida]
MGDNYFGSKPFNTPNINESFISEISNTMSEVSNVTEISDTTSETSNNFDIIDETSNIFSSSWSDIWKFFDKEKKDKTVTVKCKHCPNIKYSIIKEWIVLEDLSFTIVEELQVIPGKFAVSLDMWTSTAVKAYMRIIAHYIDKDWQLQQKTLDFVEVKGSHIGANLANEVINVLEFYQIESKKFSEIANLNNINLLPILDVPTRWNSTYMIIQRALSLKVVFDKILLIEEFLDLSNFKLSQSEWIFLENIALFLKRFTKLFTEMCSSTYLTISAAYPMYNYLMDYYEKRINDQACNKISDAAKAAWEKLQEYYNKTSESYHYISMIFDPR